MITMKLLVRQTYGAENAGTILINAHHDVINSWDSSANACMDGTLTGNIKIYTVGQDSFYIGGCTSYGSISIEKIITADEVTTINISNIQITVENSLPEEAKEIFIHYGSLAFT